MKRIEALQREAKTILGRSEPFLCTAVGYMNFCQSIRERKKVLFDEDLPMNATGQKAGEKRKENFLFSCFCYDRKGCLSRSLLLSRRTPQTMATAKRSLMLKYEPPFVSICQSLPARLHERL